MRLEQLLALHQLGLGSAASEQEIKRAYAERIKDCNPETDAETWMQLHNAYKLALSALKDGVQTSAVVISPPEPPPPAPPKEAEIVSEFDELFDEMDELAQDAGRWEVQYQQQQEMVLRSIRAAEKARRRELEAERRAREQAEHERIAKRVKRSVARLRRRAIWKMLDEEELNGLLYSPDFQAISGESWCIELLYPLLQRSVYDRRLTREAQVALSLRLAELSRHNYPDRPNISSRLPQILAKARAAAEEKAKKRRTGLGLLALALLFAIAYLPDLFPSDVSYAKKAKLYGDLTVEECISTFSGSSGFWHETGDTIAVQAGSRDRRVDAVFTLDEEKAAKGCLERLVSNSGLSSRKVYVLSFRVGDYACKSANDLDDFGLDVTMEKQGIMIRLPWKPGAGEKAREFMINILTENSAA